MPTEAEKAAEKAKIAKALTTRLEQIDAKLEALSSAPTEASSLMEDDTAKMRAAMLANIGEQREALKSKLIGDNYPGSYAHKEAIQNLEQSLKALQEINQRKKALDEFLQTQNTILSQQTKDPKLDATTAPTATTDRIKGRNISDISDPKKFFSDPRISLDALKEKSAKYLEEYRKTCGVAQTTKYEQERLDNSDLNTMVGNAANVAKDYTVATVSIDKQHGKKEDVTVRYCIAGEDPNQKLIILHNTTDVIPESSKDATADENARTAAITRFEKITAALKAKLPDDQKSLPVTHIIPEVGSGRLRKMGIGSDDMQKNSRHICLRVVEQANGQKLSAAYKASKLFDPRADLGVQNTLDDTNCGRFVAAMTIQAAGLAKDGLRITKENLMASPAVGNKRAMHFNDVDDATKGLQAAYVKPLNKHAGPEEQLAHHLQKLACLSAEYESRKGNAHRAYHGTNKTPIGGGYGTATFLTTSVASFFGAAHSATEKSDAVAKIRAQLDPNGETGGMLDKNKLPKAARSGELGKCVDAIIKAQAAINNKAQKNQNTTPSPS